MGKNKPRDDRGRNQAGNGIQAQLSQAGNQTAAVTQNQMMSAPRWIRAVEVLTQPLVDVFLVRLDEEVDGSNPPPPQSRRCQTPKPHRTKPPRLTGSNANQRR
jgi:hypothetical protein